MNQPVPTGPDLFAFAQDFYEKARAEKGYGSEEQQYFWQAAHFYAMQAQTAAAVMTAELYANATGTDHADLDGWREKIGMTWLKECRSKGWRRPACAERHTDDCDYADPPPEPKHVLLPVGTRVLVSDVVWDDARRKTVFRNPEPGKIVGYDIHKSKYRWRREWNWEEGRYSDHDHWAFVDNRVEVHPDGPECMDSEES